MKTSAVTMAMAVAMMMAASVARADDPMIEAISETSTATLNGKAQLVGTVWLSRQGQIKVIWDELKLNGGKVGLRSGEEVSAVFPSLTLDLRALGMQLELAGGSYDNDPIRGTTDTQIGRIGVALSQEMLNTDGWQLTVKESLNGGGFFKREWHRDGKTFEAVPVTLAIDAKLVRNLSEDLSVSLAMGAYGSVIHCLAGGAPIGINGGYVAADARIGELLSAGVRIDASRLRVLDGNSRALSTYSATAYVQYILSKAGQGSPMHAINLKISGIHDEVIARADGSAREGIVASVSYLVTF